MEDLRASRRVRAHTHDACAPNGLQRSRQNASAAAHPEERKWAWLRRPAPCATPHPSPSRPRPLSGRRPGPPPGHAPGSRRTRPLAARCCPRGPGRARRGRLSLQARCAHRLRFPVGGSGSRALGSARRTGRGRSRHHPPLGFPCSLLCLRTLQWGDSPAPACASPGYPSLALGHLRDPIRLPFCSHPPQTPPGLGWGSPY